LKIALEREVTATTSNLLHYQGPLRAAVFCRSSKHGSSQEVLLQIHTLTRFVGLTATVRKQALCCVPKSLSKVLVHFHETRSQAAC